MYYRSERKLFFYQSEYISFYLNIHLSVRLKFIYLNLFESISIDLNLFVPI